jgi:hypothetical protein
MVRSELIVFRKILRLSSGGTDVLYLRLLGQDMVVLSSNEAITDLVEKRSGIYADKVCDKVVFTFRF